MIMTFAAIFAAVLSCEAAFLALSTFLPLSPGSLNLAAGVVLGALAAFALVKSLRLHRRFRAGGQAGTGAALVALLAAASLCVVLAVKAVWHGRLESLRLEVAARGWPTSLAEFQEDLPDASYAQSALEQAAAKLDLAGPVKKDLQAWGGDLLDSAGGPKAGGTWGRLCPTVDGLVDKACQGRTRLAKTDYVAAAKDPLNMPLPKMAQLPTAARLLRACASRQPAARAWAQVDRQWRLAALAGTHRSLIAQLVAVDMETLGVKTALDILQRQPRAVLPDRLARAFRQRLGRNRVSEGLRAELAMHLDIPASLGRGWAGGALAWSGVIDLNVLATARMVARDAAVQTMSEARAAQQLCDAELQALPSWPYFLARVAMPSFGQLYVREFEGRDWARLALLSSAAARFRAARGRWPAALAELAPRFCEPGDLRDETAGTGFVLRAKGGGFELCAGGLKGDGKDFRGAEFCARVK
ncbi:MAG: hypothetical protein PHU21_09555 [Elusimicrobia bacterium]|nr:hypothetical protein [Elusimicrobiota bacterium]